MNLPEQTFHIGQKVYWGGTVRYVATVEIARIYTKEKEYQYQYGLVKDPEHIFVGPERNKKQVIIAEGNLRILTEEDEERLADAKKTVEENQAIVKKLLY